MSLKLDWISGASRTPVLDGRSIFVLDSQNGLIRATSADFTALGRRSFSNIAAAIRTSPNGSVVDAPGLDGKADIFGFAELPGASGRMIVAVGLARGDVLNDVDQQLERNLILGVVAATIAALFASGVSHLWLIRSISKIVSAIREISFGNKITD